MLRVFKNVILRRIFGPKGDENGSGEGSIAHLIQLYLIGLAVLSESTDCEILHSEAFSNHPTFSSLLIPDSRIKLLNVNNVFNMIENVGEIQIKLQTNQG